MLDGVFSREFEKDLGFDSALGMKFDFPKAHCNLPTSTCFCEPKSESQVENDFCLTHCIVEVIFTWIHCHSWSGRDEMVVQIQHQTPSMWWQIQEAASTQHRASERRDRTYCIYMSEKCKINQIVSYYGYRQLGNAAKTERYCTKGLVGWRNDDGAKVELKNEMRMNKQSSAKSQRIPMDEKRSINNMK
jgi:hypothetical protein